MSFTRCVLAVHMFLVLSLVASPAVSQDRVTKGEIVIDHRAGVVQFDDASTSIPLRTGGTIRVSGSKKIDVYVLGNPLFFAYKATTGKELKSSDDEALKAFAEAVQKFTTGLSIADSGSPTYDRLLEAAGENHEQLNAALKAMVEILGEVDDVVQLVSLDQIAAAQTQVRQWMTGVVADPAAGAGGRPSLPALKTDLTARLKNLRQIQAKLEASQLGITFPTSLPEGEFAGLLANTAAVTDAVVTRIPSVQAVAQDVLRIGERTKIGEFEVGKEGVITITTETRYASAVKSLKTVRPDPAWQTGERRFNIVAFSPVTFAVGPALVYSFVRSPTFSVVQESGSTDLVIKESAGDFTKQRVAAMLNVTPNALNYESIGVALQVGVTPEKNRNAFYVGGGLRLGKNLIIGGGATYQQVRKLADGLEVGQVVERLDQLKTGTEFKWGGYLNVTYEPE